MNKELKQMPYRVPEGFLDEAKQSARIAIARATVEQRPTHRLQLKMAFMAASIALIVSIIGIPVWQYNNRNSLDNYIANLKTASEDVLCDMLCDVIEYPCNEIDE